ncbi:CRISPR-associated endonuclease Cas2 [Hymenobacter ginsengisoli]|uniref:CRISPR-associated endoribonuclease Cas2 n=1 Tax=Hymenobacter ginsengisoli TaxID=1051626 RepID=A0ABP8PUL6_9BACT|nr:MULTISPECIES: CRISPR-associated endonuclease Cas2 [unclassified Hymenobacter]MBO2033807.1 CRISPR-associated endonuclease Cas2 [Hymenobacter sp. BT559]
MYVILVYDVKQQRVGKLLKLCRRYLHWIQNSVFEGEISDVKLQELLLQAASFLDKEEDSILLFKSRTEQWLEKQVWGRERSPLGSFL